MTDGSLVEQSVRVSMSGNRKADEGGLRAQGNNVSVNERTA